jgi:hypothetical protein
VGSDLVNFMDLPLRIIVRAVASYGLFQLPASL